MGSVTIKWYALLIMIIISQVADMNNTSTTKRSTAKTSTSSKSVKPKAAKPKTAKPKTTQSPEVIRALKNPSFTHYAYTFKWITMPDKNIILAGPIDNRSVTYFWLDFYGPYRKPSNYVMCKYNHTNTSLTIIPPPCGSIPSMKCLSEMINISLHNNTGEEECTLNTTFNPMLYNVPRWTTKVYLGKDYTFIDSQTIYFLGLSAAIFRNLLRHNCTKSFYLTSAMSRNLFRAPKISLWKLKQGMRRLKRKQRPDPTNKNKKQLKRSDNTTTNAPTITPNNTYNNTEINTTALVTNASETFNFKPPVIIKHLQNMVTFVYTTLRYAEKAFCDTKRDRSRQSAWANHTRQILYNDTPWSIHGYINLTDLYYNQTPPYNTTITNNSVITPLWDYIDSLAFKEQIRLNDSNLQTYKRHTNLSVSILPP
ncbi:Ba103 [Baboon cytomegalovirus]|nr:Ba103 [Baboon cytomegalovirus]